MSHHLVLLDDVNNSSPARDGISVHCIHHRLKTSTVIKIDNRERKQSTCEMHSKSWSGFMLGSHKVSHMPISCSSQVPPATKSTGSVMQPTKSYKQ